MSINDFFAAVQDHPALALLVLSAVVNLLLARVPPERLVELAATRPVGAAAILAIRSAGLDPVGLVRAAQVALSGKAAAASLAALEAPASGGAAGAGGGGQ